MTKKRILIIGVSVILLLYLSLGIYDLVFNGSLSINNLTIYTESWRINENNRLSNAHCIKCIGEKKEFICEKKDSLLKRILGGKCYYTCDGIIVNNCILY